VQVVLLLTNSVTTDSLFQLEHEACPDILNNSRSAGLFSLFFIGNEIMVQFIYKKYDSSTESLWLEVPQDSFLSDEDS
jgi:hypothetical protein